MKAAPTTETQMFAHTAAQPKGCAYNIGRMWERPHRWANVGAAFRLRVIIGHEFSPDVIRPCPPTALNKLGITK
jgi:hypothetical protein